MSSAVIDKDIDDTFKLPDYFQNTDIPQWSLIDFLQWRSKSAEFLDHDSEHSAFKNFLITICKKDKDNTRGQRAQVLLNDWQVAELLLQHTGVIAELPQCWVAELVAASKCSAEVRTFWSNRKSLNLQRDLQHVEFQKQLMLSHIEAEDLNYVLDRSRELNVHSTAIGNRRHELITAGDLNRNKQQAIDFSIEAGDNPFLIGRNGEGHQQLPAQNITPLMNKSVHSSKKRKEQEPEDDANDEEESPTRQQEVVTSKEYFDELTDKVELEYFFEEEETVQQRSRSETLVAVVWGSYSIGNVDIIKQFHSVREKLPKKTPELHPPYWGILDLTGQHKATKDKFVTIWKNIVDDFQRDVDWTMAEPNQADLNLFDNGKDINNQQAAPLLNAQLTIMRSHLEHLNLPISEGEHTVLFVAPVFNISLDPLREKFRKRWLEQQLFASQERRIDGQDPDERARIGQKTDLIIDFPVGPALEGFICEVSGGLPAGCPKKIWTDKLKIMVGMRDMINRIMKTYPGLPTEYYMKIVVFGCQVVGWQLRLYAMDLRAPGIYRFGLIDKAELPATAQELPAYEDVHIMLRSLEVRLSRLMDLCITLKIEHARLRRRRNYALQEDTLTFSNSTPKIKKTKT
ncbi:11160_t:CDS:10 [Paraglomus brasilianum]|uniref:11160_t:CDS:1 n=1 Tax=Paraglomus brasilianum TaxID=144538 RepID=A0A9N8VRI8_9GLOM|nr:11160_t:CDS:10 [Paraglomus brasilianum]